MRRITLTLIIVSVIFFVYQSPAQMQSVPDDLKIEGVSGGMHPQDENHSLVITSDGKGRYSKYIPGDVGKPPLAKSTFELRTADLKKIWHTIKKSNFFQLNSEYVNEEVTGGSFVTLTITAHGKTHQVNIENVNLPSVESILHAINKATPANKDLMYEPSSQK